MSDGAVIATIVAVMTLGLIVIIGGVVLGARTVTKHYDHISCTQFGEQSNRKVRFVTYNFWNWDCLTPTADGKWISTKNLREFGTQP